MRGWLTRHPLFAMVLPLVGWAVHFVLVYALVGLHCGASPASAARIGAGALWWGLLLATLLTATVIAAGFAHAWRSQRQAVRDDRGEVGHGEVGHGEVGRGAAGSWQRRATLSRIGMLLSLLAALAVGFTLVPLLLLGACT